MNWIIRSTKKVKFHTNLQEILKPIWENLPIYNWVLTDLDFVSDDDIPINFEQDFFTLNQQQFEQIYHSRTQINWGIIAAVPYHIKPDPINISQVSAEDSKVWDSHYFSIPESILEITAFDSGYTIVKFKDKKLSDTFKEYFQEQAIDLDSFKAKHIK
ncbi:hypothetical protein DRF65_12880 [Chryseobacterium pennae]|uniref:Uncharacterized protein n=1 Tax=Chryseobacterium pennae TaxID=2258962 RepID=A0A3D9C7Q1_9FLAO|nr:hypothetical protein [Chryseobacterium pennae]REC61917.1 hypothetical protein DRF65_12880 [Chryseobacterium pennae]